MSYYLLDNPPASRQFYPSRNGGLSGGVVIHTTEGAGGADSAEATARFIARRSDAGSYHCVVDSEPDSAVLLMPDDYTAFGVAASGYNSRCWQIAIAAPSMALDYNSMWTHVEIDNMAREIVGFWRRNGFDPLASARFVGEGVKEQAGLAHHGDVQPWDRSDAWSKREDRWVFDALLVQAIERNAGGTVAPAPPPNPFFDAVNAARGEVLRRGSQGGAVRILQVLLGGLASDGVFGPATENSVRVFQAFHGLPVDGIVGPQTWSALLD